MKGNFFSRFDYFLIGIVYALIVIGVLFIYSSNINSNGILVIKHGQIAEHVKQIMWASVGLVLMLFFTIYDYRKLESYTWIIYGILVAILVYTRLFTKEANGARSWIGIGPFAIQPSEFGKFGCILALAKYLSSSEEENPLKRFVIATAIMLVPMGLVLIQPDLGTATVYIPIFLFICFFAGIPIKFILYLLTLGITSVLFTVLPIWNTTIATEPLAIIKILTTMKYRMILLAALVIIIVVGIILRRYGKSPNYIFWIIYFTSILALSLIFSLVFEKVLKPHQIQRLIIFMNPEIDPKGAGWHIIQSKIAIGSGGSFGQTFLHGTQSHLQYLPEQSTDFIFSILSEELGYVGCIMVFILYMLILVRILFIIRKCTNKFGIYIAAGIFGMLLFHFFVNVGMVMGIMPVVGIPLLFLSYGGSSLLNALACIGLLQSINFRKNEYI